MITLTEIAQEVMDQYPLYNPVEKCDNVDGPCACGAWHNPKEILHRIQQKYGDVIITERK